jgi:L-histidine N-alpha-methyltransferase
VSASALQGAIDQIAPRFPETTVIGIHGTYEHGLALLDEVRPVMCVFLGSTLGNFDEHGMDAFLSEVAHRLRRCDRFLLGVDLVKDPSLLEAAYDDRAGVTRTFSLNLFKRMNRELGSRIDVDSVEHVAKYVEEREQVEIYARFHRRQRIVVEPLGCTLTIDAGEDVLVEVSRKFRVSDLTARLNAAGLAVDDVYGDANGWFAVLLLKPSDD